MDEEAAIRSVCTTSDDDDSPTNGSTNGMHQRYRNTKITEYGIQWRSKRLQLIAAHDGRPMNHASPNRVESDGFNVASTATSEDGDNGRDLQHHQNGNGNAREEENMSPDASSSKDSSEPTGASNVKTKRDFFILRGLRRLAKDDSRHRAAPKAIVTRLDNLKPYVITRARETTLVNKVRDIALSADNDYVGVADSFWLRACLRARNGDVDRAIALATNYLQWRRGVRYYERISNYNGIPPNIRDLLSTGTFTVAGNASRKGQPVLTIRYEYYQPHRYQVSEATTTFVLLIEYLMREYPKAQTHGMVVMEEMSRATVSNLDIRLAHFLSRAFSSIIPLRIAAMFFVNAKRGVRTALRFMSPFLARKFKTRVHVMNEQSVEQFAAFFDADQTPTFMNMHGTMQWTHEHQQLLVSRVADKCKTWPKASTFRDSQ